MSLAHGMATAATNSEHPWPLAGELNKIKPDEILPQRSECPIGLSTARKILAMDNQGWSRGGRIVLY